MIDSNATVIALAVASATFGLGASVLGQVAVEGLIDLPGRNFGSEEYEALDEIGDA